MTWKIATCSSPDAFSIGLGGRDESIQIPATRVNFWGALRRGHIVHKPQESYVLLISIIPHPKHGYMAFPMTLLDADIMESDHPDAYLGVMGEWRLEAVGAAALPRIKLLRACTSTQHFFDVLDNPLHHPEWLKACYAGLAEEVRAHIDIKENAN